MKIKKLIAVIASALLCFYAIAQDAADEVSDFESSESIFADEDAMFDEDIQDLDEAVTADIPQSGLITTVNTGTATIPLTFSGHLESELGLAYLKEEELTDKSGYFEFENNLFLTARADDTFGVRGKFTTSYDNNFDFIVSELYFDYLWLDHVYITAGKKSTSWGYMRLFSDDDDDKNHESTSDTSYTNIIYDSGSGISALARIPFSVFNISGMALYTGHEDKPSYKDMSFAGSLEFTVFHTSVNIFGRSFPDKKSPMYNPYKLPIWGVEAKKTILGADIYFQEMARIRDVARARQIKKDGVDKIISSVGMYKWWDAHYPNIGFNIEYQNIYLPNLTEDKYSNTIFLDAGIKFLVNGKSVKVGSEWRHYVEDKKGYVKPGISISGLFPHAEWNTGVKIEYGENESTILSENGKVITDSVKYTFATSIKLTLDY